MDRTLPATHRGVGAFRLVRGTVRHRGVDDYVATGGRVMRDLFVEENEGREWFEDPVLLRDLVMEKKRMTEIRFALSERQETCFK